LFFIYLFIIKFVEQSFFFLKKNTIGLNFPYDDEAEEFYKIINEKIGCKIKLKDEISALAHSTTKLSITETSPQEGFSKKKRKISKSQISSPTNFRIIQHIGFKGRNHIEVSV
jgi:hypothetical protein